MAKAQKIKKTKKRRKNYARHSNPKKKRYHTGTHRSPKSTLPVKYRSGWELTVALYLDRDPLVESYEHETLKIPYISNKRTGRKRHYIPDFLVSYLDGRKVLIEVKPGFKLETQPVIKKAEAAREWAKRNKTEYTIWSNKVIKKLQEIQKREEAKKKKKPR